MSDKFDDNSFKQSYAVEAKCEKCGSVERIILVRTSQYESFQPEKSNLTGM